MDSAYGRAKFLLGHMNSIGTVGRIMSDDASIKILDRRDYKDLEQLTKAMKSLEEITLEHEHGNALAKVNLTYT